MASSDSSDSDSRSSSSEVGDILPSPPRCQHFASKVDPHKACRTCRKCDRESQPCSVCVRISPKLWVRIDRAAAATDVRVEQRNRQKELAKAAAGGGSPVSSAASDYVCDPTPPGKASNLGRFHYRPKKQSSLPKVKPVLPKDNPVLPKVKPVLPKVKPVLPMGSPMLTKDKSVLPIDKSVLPKDKAVLPKDAALPKETVCPSDTMMLPNESAGLRKVELLGLDCDVLHDGPLVELPAPRVASTPEDKWLALARNMMLDMKVEFESAMSAKMSELLQLQHVPVQPPVQVKLEPDSDVEIIEVFDSPPRKALKSVVSVVGVSAHSSRKRSRLGCGSSPDVAVSSGRHRKKKKARRHRSRSSSPPLKQVKRSDALDAIDAKDVVPACPSPSFTPPGESAASACASAGPSAGEVGSSLLVPPHFAGRVGVGRVPGVVVPPPSPVTVVKSCAVGDITFLRPQYMDDRVFTNFGASSSRKPDPVVPLDLSEAIPSFANVRVPILPPPPAHLPKSVFTSVPSSAPPVPARLNPLLASSPASPVSRTLHLVSAAETKSSYSSDVSSRPRVSFHEPAPSDVLLDDTSEGTEQHADELQSDGFITMPEVIALVNGILPTSFLVQQKVKDLSSKNLGLNLQTTFANRLSLPTPKTHLGQSTLLLRALLFNGGLVRGSGAPLELDSPCLPPRPNKQKWFFPVKGEGAGYPSQYSTFPEAEFLTEFAAPNYGTYIKFPDEVTVKTSTLELVEKLVRVSLRAQSHADLTYSAVAAYVEQLYEHRDWDDARAILDNISKLMKRAAHTTMQAINWDVRAVANVMLVRRDAFLAKHKKLDDPKKVDLRLLPFHSSHWLFGDNLKTLEPSLFEKPKEEKAPVKSSKASAKGRSSRFTFHEDWVNPVSKPKQPFRGQPQKAIKGGGGGQQGKGSRRAGSPSPARGAGGQGKPNKK